MKFAIGIDHLSNGFNTPGGMVDKGENLEQAAAREFTEETGLTAEIGKLEYVGSFPVGDWRFKNAGEIGILTSLFFVKHTWGAPRASDDLVELKWCSISNAEEEAIKGHKALISAIRGFLNA
jgi:8-oxo-dGTP pyrophosphatase MutT (NUDIX family)